jgi:hypothetical protein
MISAFGQDLFVHLASLQAGVKFGKPVYPMNKEPSIFLKGVDNLVVRRLWHTQLHQLLHVDLNP